MISPQPTPQLSRNEGLKERSTLLTGNIAQTLADASQERFSEDDYEFLKFHGIYQQDDRDQRKVAKQYIYMVRGRLPGGVVAPGVYAAFDDLCAKFGNNSLRITTRQGFQFHGVTKGNLGKLMKGINDAMATTLAACGDVNRNVMAAPTPATSRLVDEIQRHAKQVSDALLPKTRAYYQIWVNGTELKLTDEDANFVDPLYGKTYLPRKFKVAFAIPPWNDIDVFTNDCGFIAIVENDKLVGYNLVAGGGMGMSHGNANTFPRLADVIGFISPERVIETAKCVVTMHRDFGDRTNRKHARLKYVLEDRGVPWFREEMERRLGFKFEPARPFEFTRQGDCYGWQRQFDGNYFLGLFVENGRIKDHNGYRLKRPATRDRAISVGSPPDAFAKHFAGQRQTRRPRRNREDARRTRRSGGPASHHASPRLDRLPRLADLRFGSGRSRANQSRCAQAHRSIARGSRPRR